MNTSNSSNTPAVSKQHAIRNERGQFAAILETPANVVNQMLVNQNVQHWLWLYAHGYSDVQPNELFAGQ